MTLLLTVPAVSISLVDLLYAICFVGTALEGLTVFLVGLEVFLTLARFIVGYII